MTRTRAFDPWDTIVERSRKHSKAHRDEMIRRLGVGAERAGTRAVLILRPEQDEPYWEEARGWEPRIHALPELLGLV